MNISPEEADALPDTTYWTLMAREKRLVDWALELQSDLTAICERDTL